MFVFKIDGVDFTDCIVADGGIKLKRTDIEDEKASGRNLAIRMRRARLGQLRSATFKTKVLPQARIQQLTRALKPEYIMVTYLDFEVGVTVKQFYGTDFEASALGTFNNIDYWKEGAFTLTEV